MSDGHTMNEAAALAAEIRKLRPDVEVSNHRDFGFAVDVFGPRMKRPVIACQPQRFEKDQPYIWKNASRVAHEIDEASA